MIWWTSTRSSSPGRRPGDFRFAEAGEARFLDIAAAISRMLGYGGREHRLLADRRGDRRLR
ncbi:hypothetical protein [Sorangium sp. So ce362]|uniref:hypothetical protein n=1 Tax=Sorangium sp. So ce362 TaxID=3133303 RepID=UPI003F5FDFCF